MSSAGHYGDFREEGFSERFKRISTPLEADEVLDKLRHAAPVNSSNLFRDKTDEFEERQDESIIEGVSKPYTVINSTIVGVPTPSEIVANDVQYCEGGLFDDIHPAGSRKDTCTICKKHFEDKQINSKSLQGGFKAASGKATIDLLPPYQFDDMVSFVFANTKDAEKYSPLVVALSSFWTLGFVEDLSPEDDSSQDLLIQAFDEAFRLLSEQTGGAISAIFAIGELYALGAKKYAARNWEKGIDWGIVYSAAWRHLLNHMKGELTDPVDGQLHLTSVLWNIMALRHYINNPDKYAQFDSRRTVERATDKGQK